MPSRSALTAAYDKSLWVRVRGIGIAGGMKPGGTALGGRASGYAFTTGMSAHSVV